MKGQKISCAEIELALMSEFGFIRNYIVPNVTGGWSGVVKFETDMLVVTPAGFAHGFEIKVSKSDLKADFKKEQYRNRDQIINGKSGFEFYYGMFKHFSYCVPEHMIDDALMLVPKEFGVYMARRYPNSYNPDKVLIKCMRDPIKLYHHKWSEKDIIKLLRLGTIRNYSLKAKLYTFKVENQTKLF